MLYLDLVGSGLVVYLLVVWVLGLVSFKKLDKLLFFFLLLIYIAAKLLSSFLKKNRLRLKWIAVVVGLEENRINLSPCLVE